MQPVVHDLACADGARPDAAVVWLHGVPTHGAAAHGGVEERPSAVDEDHIARVDGVEAGRGHEESLRMAMPTIGRPQTPPETNERAAGVSISRETSSDPLIFV